MAPKRRPQTTQRTPSAQQSRLSFKNKVTKPASEQRSKSSKKDPAVVEEIVPVDVKPETGSDDEREQTPSEKGDAVADPLHSASDSVRTEDVLGERAQRSGAGAVGGKGSGWVGDEEERARKVSDTQIKKYWQDKELERLAPRIHQEELTVYEKVLREWDMSGQYGPCIGIARLKRWKRANLLGLQPPIEVLAVLLKELDKGDAKAQRAYVDELMTSRFTTET